jgi:pimeloyl-ACP methyl ester carboxylesterase
MGQLIRLGTERVPDDDLRRINPPVSLLWGREDRMVPLAVAEGTRSRLGWPLDVIEGAAHVPHLERPEAFLACLAEGRRRPGQRTEPNSRHGGRVSDDEVRIGDR